jgi:adenosylcobinamide-phosphate synthase
VIPMHSTRFAAAYALDLSAGDPEALPHPVRMIGAAIAAGERRLRRPSSGGVEVLRGGVLSAAVVVASWAAARVVVGIGGAPVDILLGWTALATRSLLDESAAVLDALDAGDLPLARRRVSNIVGRDTDALDESEIARAVIETLAESLCDGVVAPLLYLAAGGAPLALAFKAANTLDSMIGHREPPYLYFGRVAARLDDAAAFVPARVAALAIVAGAALTNQDVRRAWSVWQRDGGMHPSPNAGQTEAAMAGALGVRLGGINYYEGEPSPKPVLGSEGRPAATADARTAMRIVAVASLSVFVGLWLCLRLREGDG